MSPFSGFVPFSISTSIPTNLFKYPDKILACTSNLDVARSEIKLDYIKEITEMLPLFKVNEIVMHINDDRGDKIADTTIGSEQNIKQTKDLSAFRIENDKNIGGHAYQISKADYIEYQLEAAKYGVSVVTELDTPAHSAVFSLLPEMHHHDHH